MKPTKALYLALAAALVFLPALNRAAAQPHPNGIRWNFDETSGKTAHDSIGNVDDAIEGFFWRVPGAEGQGLQFDGYTTRIDRAADKVPAIKGGFTVSAWVAPNYYPWNWVPLADQNLDQQVGFFFGLDAFGHPGFGVSVNGVWRQLTSTQTIPVKRYSLVTGTFDPKSGLALYIDGKPAGELNAPGTFSQAIGTDLIVGRVREPQQPYPSWLDAFRDPVNYSLDGYLDNLEIVEGARSAADEQAEFAKANLPDKDVMPTAVFPSGPKGAGPFGAFYASLKFERSWDRPRRFGPDQDVVVRFEQSPMRLVFWEGTNFIPAWVTENGKWYTDEFLETWGRPRCPDGGDCEPMSDKQGRYSHVSILESSDARAVVHWRYALAEAINYKGGNADPVTGWFDWADEYWTVYPDGVAVRKQILSSSHLDDAPHEWQETIVINNPGQMPEDNIEPGALTLMNMAGQSETYHWQPKTEKTFDYPKGPPDKLDKPANANIQIVHLKSKENPFEIVWPKGNSMSTYSDTKSYSMFEWWDHWPVAQISNSFRLAVTPDRPSHASLSHIYWDPYERTDDTMTKLLLCGLTSPDAPGIVTLAKSWLSPAAIAATGAGITGQEYDPAQRAFVVHRGQGAAGPVTVTLNASADNPLVNPAMVIENWTGRVKVSVNGKLMAGKDHVRTGFATEEGASNLVVWFKMDASAKTVIELTPLPD